MGDESASILHVPRLGFFPKLAHPFISLEAHYALNYLIGYQIPGICSTGDLNPVTRNSAGLLGHFRRSILDFRLDSTQFGLISSLEE